MHLLMLSPQWPQYHPDAHAHVAGDAAAAEGAEATTSETTPTANAALECKGGDS